MCSVFPGLLTHDIVKYREVKICRQIVYKRFIYQFIMAHKSHNLSIMVFWLSLIHLLHGGLFVLFFAVVEVRQLLAIVLVAVVLVDAQTELDEAVDVDAVCGSRRSGAPRG